MYEFANGVMSILLAPTTTAEEVAKLREILLAARQSKATPQTVAEQITSKVPGLSALAEWLSTKDSTWWITAMGLIVSLLAWQFPVGQGGNSAPTPPPPTAGITINNNITNEVKSTPARTIRNDEQEAPPGRNDPCPCGSGEKFKKCCGKGQ
jgi:hypothetical protein